MKISQLIVATSKKTITHTNPIVGGIPVTEHATRNFFSDKFQLRIFLIDFTLLNSNFLLCLIANNNINSIRSNLSVWMALIISINCIWLLIAMYNDIYKWYEIIKPFKKIENLMYINGMFFSILTTIYYYTFFPILGTNLLLAFILLFGVSNIVSHLLFRQYFQNRMPIFRYVIVGGKPSNLAYIQTIYQKIYGEKSYCLGGFSIDPIAVCKWLGGYKNIENFILHNKFDKLIYVYSQLDYKEIKRIIELCENRFIDFEVVPIDLDIIGRGARVVYENDLITLKAQLEPLQRLRNKLLKRGFDVVFSSLVIILIFPWLFSIIAIAIRLESKGPIFFVQQRTGYWNESFRFIKFRSMTINEESNTKQATRNDTRVTKVGAFLRKTSLDELPQFFNVLMGQMSVVGPRPHMLKHTEKYSNLIETYLVRHKIKPGITGWAQINGYRGPTEELYKMKKRVGYDVHYIKKWTFLMDIRCVIFTVINMVRGEKNAF